jgi:preprotein translocase subunit SecG
MLHGFLVFLHVLVSILLIVTVLLQSGKGGGLAGTFGGAGVTGGVFGGRGAAPFLAKATTVFAILFMLTAISLNFVTPGTRSAKSVIERVAPNTPQSGSQPAVPGQTPSAPSQSAPAPQTPSGGTQQ